jgi:acyl-CoA thioesterase II
MDTRAFLGLEPSHNPFRWVLDVRPEVCTGGHFLFGGPGLGAAISALEGTSGRDLVWATGQYLSYAKPGEVMDIDVTIAVEGHQITQAATPLRHERHHQRASRRAAGRGAAAGGTGRDPR